MQRIRTREKRLIWCWAQGTDCLTLGLNLVVGVRAHVFCEQVCVSSMDVSSFSCYRHTFWIAVQQHRLWCWKLVAGPRLRMQTVGCLHSCGTLVGVTSSCRRRNCGSPQARAWKAFCFSEVFACDLACLRRLCAWLQHALGRLLF